jgi:hypothetical protein
MINRRTLLKYGFFGTGLLTISGIGLGLQQTNRVKANGDLLVLSEDEFSILHAIAERLIPGNNQFPAASNVRVAEKIDQLLSTSAEYVQTEIKQVLHLFENALIGALFEGHTRPFSQSSIKVQNQLLRSWQLSSLHLRRTAFKALNGLCGAVYYSQPTTHQFLGYDGPPAHLLAMVKAAGDQ